LLFEWNPSTLNYTAEWLLFVTIAVTLPELRCAPMGYLRV